jgi:hypothetical protein
LSELVPDSMKAILPLINGSPASSKYCVDNVPNLANVITPMLFCRHVCRGVHYNLSCCMACWVFIDGPSRYSYWGASSSPPRAPTVAAAPKLALFSVAILAASVASWPAPISAKSMSVLINSSESSKEFL